MARITLVDTALSQVLLVDLDKRQRETIFPPGQERYINPIDLDELAAKLTDLGSAITAAAVVTGTVDADDVSLGNIDTVISDVVLTAQEQQEVQDILSVRLIETGHFLLSFDRGQIAGRIAEGQVKVFPDDAAGLYTI